MSFFVYLHTSPSGKSYVGWARDVARRWAGHKLAAIKHASPLAFHRAIRKYGAASFETRVLEHMSTEAGAKRAEQLWIRELGTLNPSGYNMTEGGDGGRQCAEARAKMSASGRGKPKTAEHRAKIGAAHVGLKRSAEARANMRKPHRLSAVSSATCCPDRPAVALGLCGACYRAQRLGSKTRYTRRPLLVAPCCPDKTLFAKGLCASCYYRQYQKRKAAQNSI